MNAPWTFDHTFTHAGTFAYYCTGSRERQWEWYGERHVGDDHGDARDGHLDSRSR